MKVNVANVRQFWVRLADRFLIWENWPLSIKYILLSPVWIWYCIKSRCVWFFTSSNPTLMFGGFEGEGKKEMYAQLPADAYPRTVFVSPGDYFIRVRQYFDNGTLNFPVAVKPDIGMSGLMFRKISNIDDLRKYHEAMAVDYIIQAYVDYPLEVSVFYYRYPGERKGHVTGIVKKEGLSVVGDGSSTLLQLIKADARVSKRMREMRCKHSDKLNTIIAKGETFVLSDALNLSRGGKLTSLEHEIDDQLRNVFDTIADHAGQFYYGRYDVKCSSIRDLKTFKNFSILEFNGAGADPHHVYGGGRTFGQALSVILAHWKVLYKISMVNRKLGVKAWTFFEGLKHMWWSHWHFKSLTKLDYQFNLLREEVSTPVEYLDLKVRQTSNDPRLA
jgi:hypothetical protein